MTSKRKDQQIPNVNGSHCMTWRELVEADDYATSLTVDPFLGFKTHKMTEMRLRLTDRVKDRLKKVIIDFQQHKEYEKAFRELTTEDVYIKRQFRNDSRFRDHIYRYLLLFDDRSGVQIRPCWRYASEHHVGAAIFATKNWSKGSRIDSLVGCIAELNYDDEVSFLRHKQNDFSVMYSSRKNRSQLWLGPAAYVNHDCQPNCAFTINCDGDARMSLNALIDIKRGDEIFIYYGKHFFDANNSSCECFTCELLGRGFFSPSKTAAMAPTPVEEVGRPNPPTRGVDENTSRARARTATTAPHGGDVLVEVLRERLMQTPIRRTSNSRIFSELQADNNFAAASSDSADEKAQPTPAAMNGLLVKGLSTGLAQKAVNTASYSLRHTGSRLNRVKEKIYSEMLSCLQPQGASVSRRPSRRSTPSTVKSTPTTPRRYSLRARSTANVAMREKRQLMGKRLTLRVRAAPSTSMLSRDLDQLPQVVDLTTSPESPTVSRKISRHRDLSMWNCVAQCPSPSTSSTSTVAATQADSDVLPKRPQRRRLTNTTRRLISNPSSSNNAASASTYFLRQAPHRPSNVPIAVDIPSTPPPSASTHSPCSSVSTCPAVGTTPRLVLVCKRSRPASSVGTEEREEVDEWFVKEDHPTPPPLHSSNSFLTNFYDEGGGGGSSNNNDGGSGCVGEKVVTRLSLSRHKRFWGTSVSSVSNTPSPPHLQAASPPPPILQQAPDDRFVFPRVNSCVLGRLCSSTETAPPLESDEVSDGERLLAAGVELRPLTVTIKRLGQNLYCVPTTPTDCDSSLTE
uniref:[histone H4]-N-methyl-L-lysine(20) N-methyltransferase n=1 Tax=Mesocestoides corti TaxID=53468 RepID=A0A5K3FH66_MESCO